MNAIKRKAQNLLIVIEIKWIYTFIEKFNAIKNIRYEKKINK